MCVSQSCPLLPSSFFKGWSSWASGRRAGSETGAGFGEGGWGLLYGTMLWTLPLRSWESSVPPSPSLPIPQCCASGLAFPQELGHPAPHPRQRLLLGILIASPFSLASCSGERGPRSSQIKCPRKGPLVMPSITSSLFSRGWEEGLMPQVDVGRGYPGRLGTRKEQRFQAWGTGAGGGGRRQARLA